MASKLALLILLMSVVLEDSCVTSLQCFECGGRPVAVLGLPSCQAPNNKTAPSGYSCFHGSVTVQYQNGTHEEYEIRHNFQTGADCVDAGCVLITNLGNAVSGMTVVNCNGTCCSTDLCNVRNDSLTTGTPSQPMSQSATSSGEQATNTTTVPPVKVTTSKATGVVLRPTFTNLGTYAVVAVLLHGLFLLS